jgi:hypothetical protein
MFQKKPCSTWLLWDNWRESSFHIPTTHWLVPIIPESFSSARNFWLRIVIRSDFGIIDMTTALLVDMLQQLITFNTTNILKKILLPFQTLITISIWLSLSLSLSLSIYIYIYIYILPFWQNSLHLFCLLICYTCNIYVPPKIPNPCLSVAIQLSVSFVQPIILFFSNLMPLLVSFSALYFMLRKRLEQKGSRAVVFYYRKFPLRWYCICHACHNILKTKNKTHTMHGSSSFMLAQFLGYRD